MTLFSRVKLANSDAAVALASFDPRASDSLRPKSRPQAAVQAWPQ
ncbi:MAG: hypothetical protein ABL933_13835 [Methyloglobulus sp.]